MKPSVVTLIVMSVTITTAILAGAAGFLFGYSEGFAQARVQQNLEHLSGDLYQLKH